MLRSTRFFQVILFISLICFPQIFFGQDFEQYKSQRKSHYQNYVKQRQKEYEKYKQNYQSYINNLKNDKQEFLNKGDKKSAKVVDEIISYEGKVTSSTPRQHKTDKIILPAPEKKEKKAPSHQEKEAATPSGYPVPKDKSRISSHFGMRHHPILKRRRMHPGIDLACLGGTPILATCSGKVVYAGRNGSYGKFVVVKHLNGYSTAYAHLRKINVRKGQKIKKGSLIGEVGTTGRSTGNHLHYEVRINDTPTNPFKYF